jgi:hypothetical protein
MTFVINWINADPTRFSERREALAVDRQEEPRGHRRLARPPQDQLGQRVPDAEEDGVYGHALRPGNVEQLLKRRAKRCDRKLPRREFWFHYNK